MEPSSNPSPSADHSASLVSIDACPAPSSSPPPSLVAPSSCRRRFRWQRALVLLAALSAAALCRFIYLDRPDQCYRRALQAVARDDFDQARYLLLRLQSIPEYEPHAALIGGVLKLHENEFDDALHELHFAVEHPRTKGLALTLMGRTLLLKHQFHAAERVLQAAVEHDPNLVEAHRLLGAAYFEVGNMVGAATYFRHAIKLSPDDPRPYRSLGIIRLEFRQTEEAIDDFREALRLDEGNSWHLSADERQETLVDLAKIQEQDLSNHEEALATLEQAADTPDALGLRAQCHYALGDLQAASDCAQRALQLDPDHVDSLLVKVRLAMNANEAAAAEALLNQVLKVQPKHKIAHHMMAQALQRLGKEDLAAQHTQQESELNELKRELDKQYERAAREPPGAPDCFRLGLVAERAGEEVMAVNFYRAAILLDPQHAGALGRLAQLRGGAGGQ
jgi:tetratricopeptide (TPR) repeat protein